MQVIARFGGRIYALADIETAYAALVGPLAMFVGRSAIC